MAMNTQTQTFRGFCRAGELNAQTAVECRFGGEVETVLSVHAAATLSGAEAEDGAVRYFGKVLFSVVYEDGNVIVADKESGVNSALIIMCISLGVAIPNIFGRRFIAHSKNARLKELLQERKERGKFVEW